MKSVLDYLTKDEHPVISIARNFSKTKYVEYLNMHISEDTIQEAILVAHEVNNLDFINLFTKYRECSIILPLEEAWMYGIADNSFSKEHEWNDTKKYSNKVSIEFHPKYNLWKSKSQYTLTNKKDEYISHCQFDEIPSNNGIIAGIIDGFSKEKGAYRMLIYAILVTKSNYGVMSDNKVSFQASKSWSKTVTDDTFIPFLYNSYTKEIISFDEEKSFSKDDSNFRYRVGVILKNTTIAIVEDLNYRILRNINPISNSYMILERLFKGL